MYVFATKRDLECCGCLLQKSRWVESDGPFGGYMEPVEPIIETHITTMTDRELLARVLAEYDENMLRTPSFVTMELIREQLHLRAEPPLVDVVLEAVVSPEGFGPITDERRLAVYRRIAERIAERLAVVLEEGPPGLTVDELEWALSGLRIEPLGRSWTWRQTAERIAGVVAAERARPDSVLPHRVAKPPSIECLCGDIFPTVNAMDQHIHIVHTDPDAVE